MPKQSDIQLRGHCQCCGRLQAVPNGRMSKHGYEVKNGWFQGVCSGENFAPIEVDREMADHVITSVRAQVEQLLEDAAAYRINKKHPDTAKSGKYIKVEKKTQWGTLYITSVDEYVPYAEASEYYQKEARNSAAWHSEQRARMGESFSKELERIVNEYHNKPLMVIEKPKAAPRIQPGEQRRSTDNSPILTALYQEGAMVHYEYSRSNGMKFRTKTSSRAWRNMQLVKEAL